MLAFTDLRDFARSLPETEEAPHFDIISYRIKKKIFATVNVPENRATVYLTPEDQDVFCACSQGAMFPVPNRWGHFGWTHIDLEKASWELCQDAFRLAWHARAPKALAAKYPLEES